MKCANMQNLIAAIAHEEGLQVPAARRSSRVREVLCGPVPAWGRFSEAIKS